ncbi:ATP-dependent Clp protease ATP-binding subunit ClpX, partial [bacterium]|nr:ATP-dependent Clp protease ATP-binding subunit ClpX [bacterium]
GVQLTFAPEALKAVVQNASKRGTGARGLRSEMEGAMLDIMYHLPSQSKIKQCLITREVITKGTQPILTKAPRRKQATRG